MRIIARLITPLLVVAALLSCSHSIEPARLETEDPIVWLTGNAHSIALESSSFDDLAFLRPVLQDKRVVQLGENTHGVREYNLLKARIARFLHEELGFDVLVFESALYQCFDADLTAAEASAVSTLTNCTFGIWHTEEVLPLFEHLRESRQTPRPLRLAGIDVQPIGRNKAGRPRFLSDVVAAVDKDYAADVLTLDSTFLDVYAKGGRERRAYFRSDDGQRMADAYERLAEFIASHEAAILTASTTFARSAIGAARQTARSIWWYIRQQSAPTTRTYVERRDEGMAENLSFLLDELYSDQKVIVWGHNFHLRHDNMSIPPDTSMFPDVAARTMGTWIRDRYGEEIYTVGLYAYTGRAADNSGEAYEIEPAEPGSLEDLLHRTGAEALFVDLSRAPAGPGTAWMDEPMSARYNGTAPLSMVLRNQYDAIIFVDEAHPRVPLY